MNREAALEKSTSDTFSAALERFQREIRRDLHLIDACGDDEGTLLFVPLIFRGLQHQHDQFQFLKRKFTHELMRKPQELLQQLTQ